MRNWEKQNYGICKARGVTFRIQQSGSLTNNSALYYEQHVNSTSTACKFHSECAINTSLSCDIPAADLFKRATMH